MRTRQEASRRLRAGHRLPDQRISGYVTALARRRRLLANVALIYRDQPSVFPSQAQATVEHLGEIRGVVLAARAYLQNLSPNEVRQVRPYACLCRLEDLDRRLTEIVLTAGMFAPICQQITPSRVQLHAAIRSWFPLALACYDDALSMLSVLLEAARLVAWRGEEVQP